MKNLIFICFAFISFNSFAGVCLNEMTTLNNEENAWMIEHNNTDVETTLMTKKDVEEAIEWNNTDLEDSDIEDIMAFIDEPGVEFYSFFTNVSIGSASDMVMVNTYDCSILERYSIFEE